MHNNTVLSLFFDRTENLWMGLDNGIDYVLFSSPLRTLLGTPNTFGTGYAAMSVGDRLLLGTNQGLYDIPLHPVSSRVPPQPSSLIAGQIWSIDSIDGSVFVSGDHGLYELDGGNQPKLLDNSTGFTAATALRGQPGHALAAGYDGFYNLDRRADGVWRLGGRVEGYTGVTGPLYQDSDGNLWLANWLKGIYRLRLNGDRSAFVLNKLYNSDKGLPTDANNVLTEIDNIVYAVGDNGSFYRYSADGDSMELQTGLSKRMGLKRRANVCQIDNRTMLAASERLVWLAHTDYDGMINIDSLSFNHLHTSVNVTSRPAVLPGGNLVLPNLEGFYALDPRPRHEDFMQPKPFVSAVYSGDSLIYFANVKPGATPLKVDYNMNSLRFQVGFAEYNTPGAVLYAFCLEGYEPESALESFSPDFSKEYTQLHEGKYRLKVAVLDVFTGQREETEFAFTVLAPWYRSVWAWLVYCVLFVLTLSVTVKAVRHYSRRSAQRIQQQKDKEIDRLHKEAEAEAKRRDIEIKAMKAEQLETTIKQKSEELSNTTMNVLRKNEILLDIAENLERLRTKMEDEGAVSARLKEVSKLQKQIRENISHDDDWKGFTANFDIVYENFTKNLRERHPELTVTDLRICCYLRMGLSSKDIAPLMNISHRSVEMSRYRLRKKLGLERSDSLTDYLINLT